MLDMKTFILINYLAQFVPPQFMFQLHAEQSALGVPWPLQSRVHSDINKNVSLDIIIHA